MITNEIPEAALYRHSWAMKERSESRGCQQWQNQPPVTMKREPKTIIHNHFNIIINISPDTTDERISAIVEELTTIVDRVNVPR